MIQKIALILLLFSYHLNVAYSQNIPKKVIINGYIKNFQNQMQVENMSEFEKLNLPNLERTFVPDSIGKFSVSFYIDQPNYFRLGRNILYLSPGDSLSVKLDFKDPQKGIFYGNPQSSIIANQYLKATPFPKDGSFLKGEDNIQKTIQASIDTVILIGLKREKELESLNDLATEFRILEKERIKADIANSLLYIETYSYSKYKINQDSMSSFLIKCDSILNPYVFKYLGNEINPFFLKLEVYRNIISYVIDSFPETVNSKKIKDYLNACSLVKKAIHLSNKREISALLPEIDKINNQAYKNCLNTVIERLLKLNNEDKAINFVISDIKGRKQDLKKNIGKVIYIDIWATWCGPCLTELPFFDSLSQKFRNQKDIVFISLSIDDDILKWKQYLRKNNKYNNQWITDRGVLKEYNVITIPRVIIIDKEFNIALMNGELPSSEKNYHFLKNLIDKPSKLTLLR